MQRRGYLSQQLFTRAFRWFPPAKRKWARVRSPVPTLILCGRFLSRDELLLGPRFGRHHSVDAVIHHELAVVFS